MPTTQEILKELETLLGKNWPLDLKGVVGEIGACMAIAAMRDESKEKLWDTRSNFLHEQSEAFIKFFYTQYLKRNAKT